MQSATVAQAAASQSGGVACAADSLSRRVAPVAFRAHLVVRLVTHPSFCATILLYDPGVRGLHASHPTNQPTHGPWPPREIPTPSSAAIPVHRCGRSRALSFCGPKDSSHWTRRASPEFGIFGSPLAKLRF
mgnify:CR=1 FL=1